MICKDSKNSSVKEWGQYYYEGIPGKLDNDLIYSLIDDLGNDNLEIHYQSKFRSNDKKPFGAEALLRWKHSIRGYIPPQEFIPIAESTGLIHELGAWVLDKVLSQLHYMISQMGEEFIVSVNVSPQELKSQSYIEDVSRLLKKHKINPGNLELEITEGLKLEDSLNVRNNINELKSMGIAISMDDFGSGFSNLNGLISIQPQTIKIDRSFISQLNEETIEFAILSYIIQLAGTLGINVIAEGIETNHQREILEKLGCLKHQGYLYDKPMPIDKLIKKYIGV